MRMRLTLHTSNKQVIGGDMNKELNTFITPYRLDTGEEGVAINSPLESSRMERKKTPFPMLPRNLSDFHFDGFRAELRCRPQRFR